MGENWTSVSVFLRQRWERQVIAGAGKGAVLYIGFSRADVVATLDAYSVTEPGQRRQVFDDVLEMEAAARAILNERS